MEGKCQSTHVQHLKYFWTLMVLGSTGSPLLFPLLEANQRLQQTCYAATTPAPSFGVLLFKTNGGQKKGKKKDNTENLLALLVC